MMMFDLRKGRRACCGATLGALIVACGLPVQAQTEVPAAKMTGYVEAGGLSHSLSNGYGVWNGGFVRGVLQSDDKNVWNAELLDVKQFGDRGTMAVLGNTHTFNEDWYGSAAIAGSSGSVSMPRLRLDVTLNRKWLEEKNLITTVGATKVDAPDGHLDRSVLLAASYYFTQPWIVEGGIRFNQSNPGRVYSNASYAAATYGRDKERLVSLRYGFGEEAYQAIGVGSTLTNFRSNTWTLTWREWLQAGFGVQARAESYHNPFYDRQGIEISVFKEF